MLLHILIIMVYFQNTYTGKSGYITVINETDSDWELIEQKSKNMNSWTFPNMIKTQRVSHIYVEWSRKLFHNSKEKQGTAVYRLIEAKEKQIVIQAENFKIIVFFRNISIDEKPDDSVYNLGWVQNGDVTFILVEYFGRFTGTNSNTSDWIRNNLDMLGKKTLKQICIPGTHNSGMSLCVSSTSLSHPCNTLTQSYTIKGQLHFGIRYFDIRPVLNNGLFRTGHYHKVPKSWQGCAGQTIKSIVEEINEYTKKRSEVLILSLSHSHNTDLTEKNFRKFDQCEWERLLLKLDKIKHLYHADGMKRLSEFTIEELTENGKTSAVIILVENMNVELNERWGKGYYYSNDIEIYNVYSKTNILMDMAEDQINKMGTYSEDYYFLLSWTLTQNYRQALLCRIKGVNSIQYLAKEANSRLPYILYPEITLNSYPNVISIDDVKNTEVTALALAINKLLT